MDFQEALKSIRCYGSWVRRLDWPDGQYAFHEDAVDFSIYEHIHWKNCKNAKGNLDFQFASVKIPNGDVVNFSSDEPEKSPRGPSIWERIRDPDGYIPAKPSEWDIVPLYGLFEVSARITNFKFYEVRSTRDSSISGWYRKEGVRVRLPKPEAEIYCKWVNDNPPRKISRMDPTSKVKLICITIVLGLLFVFGGSLWHVVHSDRMRARERAECERQGGIVRDSWCMPKSAEPLMKFEFTR